MLDQLTDVDQFDIWLKPLRAEVRGGKLVLWALNRYVKDAVEGLFLARIEQLASADVRGVEVWIVAGDRTPSHTSVR